MTKPAELDALGDVNPAVRTALTPLFVPAPVPWDHDDKSPQKTLDEHLDPLPEKLYNAWGSRDAFVDLVYEDDWPRVDDDDLHPLTWLVEECRDIGVALIPAVSGTKPPAYIRAAREIHRNHGCGACFRLPVYPRLTSIFTEISELLEELDLGIGDVDLMLDLKTWPTIESARALEHIKAALEQLPEPREWRSVIVSGTTIPRDMTDMQQGIEIANRTEWQIYAFLASKEVLRQRTPTFSDYSVNHPEPSTIDPRKMSQSTSLRYTIPNSWLFAKGQPYRNSGRRGRTRSQEGTRGTGPTTGGINMFPVAKMLISSKFFAGRDHCVGDQWIVATAAESTSGGNPQVWRRVATTHHLTRVTEDIATLFSP